MTEGQADPLAIAEQAPWRDPVPVELLYDLLMAKDFDAISASMHLIVRMDDGEHVD